VCVLGEQPFDELLQRSKDLHDLVKAIDTPFHQERYQARRTWQVPYTGHVIEWLELDYQIDRVRALPVVERWATDASLRRTDLSATKYVPQDSIVFSCGLAGEAREVIPCPDAPKRSLEARLFARTLTVTAATSREK
jgi:hypothetical protein